MRFYPWSGAGERPIPADAWAGLLLATLYVQCKLLILLHYPYRITSLIRE